jgi:probable phosphoglycerate mutase
VEADRSGPIVFVVRHGETEWSRDGLHTSRTDLDLTPVGEEQAASLRLAFDSIPVDLVLCSPKLRATRTAVLAGLIPFEIADDLQEWDYGKLEGLTSTQIQEEWPGWNIWDGPWPGGETAGDVAARADRLLSGVLRSGAGTVALVGHGHFSRVVAARWVGAPVPVGRWLALDTATVSMLGWAKGAPAWCCWNAPVRP